jgi:hypothetical protein
MGTPKGTFLPTGRPSPSDVESPGPPWAVLAASLPATAALLAKMKAIDLAYHVRAGELAIRTGDVVRTDPFTFTRGGLPWLNQQWAAQLIYRFAHSLLGWAGIAMTHAASIGTGFWFLYRSCVRAGVVPRTGAVLTLLGFVVGGASLGARPQSLAVPVFTGTWLLLAQRGRRIWLVPLLAMIWANVHGSFVLAPVLTGFALGDDLLERRPAGPGLVLLLATVAATFVTPFGPAVWSYTLEIAGDETIRNQVTEWRSPSPLTVAGGLFWLSGAGVAITAVSRRRRVRPIDVARLVAFFALGIPAARGTLWWALVAPPIVAGWFPRPEHVVGEPTDTAAPSRAMTAVILALLPIALLLHVGTDPATGASARLAADAPETLVGATRRNLPPGSRLFVYQRFASWFEYSLPAYPVMVDSRIEVFSDATWRDYDVVIEAGEGWGRVLNRYDIQGVVLPQRAVLARELSRADAWRLVADVPAGSVFVRG